jgi:dethiobiotin synthetase
VLVGESVLSELAQADEHEVVQTVQEHFADYYAVNPDTFSLNLSPPLMIDSIGKAVHCAEHTHTLSLSL